MRQTVHWAPWATSRLNDQTSPVTLLQADPLAEDAVVRATFDSAPEGIVVVAQDGRLLAYNARFLALWNFPPDMLARRDAAEMRLHTSRQMKDPTFGLWEIVRNWPGQQRQATCEACSTIRGWLGQISPDREPNSAGSGVKSRPMSGLQRSTS